MDTHITTTLHSQDPGATVERDRLPAGNRSTTSRSLPGLVAAAALLGFATPALAAPDATARKDGKLTVTGSTQCRNAYVSTTGAWGSARICWTPSSDGYKATVKGTIKDTKGDSQRARLYVGYYHKSFFGTLHFTSDDIATAHPVNHTAYGAWSKDHVRDVVIYACTVDRFGTTYHCSGDR